MQRHYDRTSSGGSSTAESALRHSTTSQGSIDVGSEAGSFASQRGRAGGCNLAVHSFEAGLEQFVGALAAARARGCTSPSALSSAAVCCLRLGHVARAMKFASEALFLKPQDEELRHLIKECTRELEFQAREQQLMAEPQQLETSPIALLITQLGGSEEGEGAPDASDPSELLSRLAQQLERGGVDAQVCFHLQGGYSTVLPLFPAYSLLVADVLLAAGRCHLHRLATAASSARVSAADLSGLIAAPKRSAVRVRWPQLVLERLVSSVLECYDGAQQLQHQQQQPQQSTALQLLAFAALDPHQRQAGLVSAAEQQPSQAPLQRLLDAAATPWISHGLPASSCAMLLRIVAAFSSGSKFDLQMLQRATRGRPLHLLLHAYTSVEHCGGSDNLGSRPACCEVSHLALSSMLSLCSREPALLKAEAFVPSSASSSSLAWASSRSASSANLSSGDSAPSTEPAAARLLLSPTGLLRELVAEARGVLQHLQPCTVPDVAWDGSTKAFMQGKGAADPCGPHVGSNASLLEQWVRLMGAAACAGRAASRELQRAGMLDHLEYLISQCPGCPQQLTEAVEEAYGSATRHSQVVAQEVCSSTSPLVALAGVAMHSHIPVLVLAALDRLTPKVDQATGAEFASLMRPGGVLAACHQLMVLTLPAAAGAMPAGPSAPINGSGGWAASGISAPEPACAVHPWEAALTAASLSANPFKASPAALLAPPPALATDCPHASALKDAARCLLTNCMDRSRRMAKLKPMQVPKYGFLALVRPRELLMLERRLREEWASAVLPQLPRHSPLMASSSSSTRDACPAPSVVAAVATAQLQPLQPLELPPTIALATSSSIASSSGAVEPLARSISSEVHTQPAALPADLLERSASSCAEPVTAAAAATAAPQPDLLGATISPFGPMTPQTPIYSSDPVPADLLMRTHNRSESSPALNDHRDTEAPSDRSPLRQQNQQQLSNKTSLQPQQQDEEDEEGGYDEDGLRIVYDSGPSKQVRAHRAAWKALDLRDIVSWSQTSDEVNVLIKLPRGTAARELDVSVRPSSLCLKLGWCGRFLDGDLKRNVRAQESVWCLEGLSDDGTFDTLRIMLPKDAPAFWRGLFEGGEEKSHMEILKEAVEADEPVTSYDDLDDGAREILHDSEVIEAVLEVQHSRRDERLPLSQVMEDLFCPALPHFITS